MFLISSRRRGYGFGIGMKRSEKVNFKIRDWGNEGKLPYMLIVGQKEKESSTVGLRQHKHGDLGAVSLTEFVEKAKQEYFTRSL